MLYLTFLLSNPGSEGGSPWAMLVPMLLIFVIFYFLLIRPQQKKQKDHQQMVQTLHRGDKIVTNGGLYGTVFDVKEHVIVLKLTDDVKVELVKSAVATIIDKKE